MSEATLEAAALLLLRLRSPACCAVLCGQRRTSSERFRPRKKTTAGVTGKEHLTVFLLFFLGRSDVNDEISTDEGIRFPQDRDDTLFINVTSGRVR